MKSYSFGIVVVGAVVALSAIAAATVAVVLGQIDAAAFSAIIGSAIGSAATAGAHAVVQNGSKRPADPPIVEVPGGN